MDRIHIAIAEDHEILREAVANTIEGFGIQVSIRAENGADLLQQIEIKGAPKLCIVDIQMPVMGGFETTYFLKQKWPNVKIIAFSMHADQNAISEVLTAGADLYLPKSVSLDKLITAIRQLCK